MQGYNSCTCMLVVLQGARQSFDPVVIANYLRDLGDKYNEDLEEPARNIIAEAVNKKVMPPPKFG